MAARAKQSGGERPKTKSSTERPAGHAGQGPGAAGQQGAALDATARANKIITTRKITRALAVAAADQPKSAAVDCQQLKEAAAKGVVGVRGAARAAGVRAAS